MYGRVSHVQGKLKLREEVPEELRYKRNTNDQVNAGGADRHRGDNGGHLIGYRFNGIGDLGNLVPQNSKYNKNGGDWYELEKQWEKALRDKKTVEVEITPIYSGESERPIAIEVIECINEEQRKIRILNP